MAHAFFHQNLLCWVSAEQQLLVSITMSEKNVLLSASFAVLESNLHGLSAILFSLAVHNVCPF